MSENDPKPAIKIVETDEANADTGPSGAASFKKSTVDLTPLPDGVAGRERDNVMEMSASDLTNLDVKQSELSAGEIDVTGDEDNVEEQDVVSDMPNVSAIKPKIRHARRVSVSAESYDPSKEAKDAEVNIPEHPKTTEEMQSLKAAMAHALIFRALDPSQFEKVGGKG